MYPFLIRLVILTKTHTGVLPMKEFFKSIRLPLIICSMAALLCGIAVGIFMGNMLKSAVEFHIEKTQADEKNTKTYSRIHFILCDHEIEVESNDLTDGGKIEIVGYCPLHYVVRYNGNNLSVYKRNTISLKEEYIMNIEFDAEYVDVKTKEELKRGIAFSSFDEINRYFENLSS